MRIEMTTWDDGTNKDTKILIDWFDEVWWRWKLYRFQQALSDRELQVRVAVRTVLVGTVVAYWCQRFGWF